MINGDDFHSNPVFALHLQAQQTTEHQIVGITISGQWLVVNTEPELGGGQHDRQLELGMNSERKNGVPFFISPAKMYIQIKQLNKDNSEVYV